MAPATDNVAPRDDHSSQCSGHFVPAPSAIDATKTQDATAELSAPASRSIPGEHPGVGTLHDAESPSVSQLKPPTTPDYEVELAAARNNAIQDVIFQVLNDCVGERLAKRIEAYAARYNIAVRDVYEMIADRPLAAAPMFMQDPIKASFHEKRAVQYCRELVEFPDSPLYAVANLPNKGPSAMYLTSQGVLHENELGRLLPRGSSIDVNTLVANQHRGDWSVMQFHKYTHEDGGSQERQFDNVITWAKAVRRFCFTEAIAHRSLDSMPNSYNAAYVAVLDGGFWTPERTKAVRRAGGADDACVPGGFYVVSTAELAELYDNLASA